jgi:MFS family permease
MVDVHDTQNAPPPPGSLGDRLRVYVAIPAALLMFNAAFFLIRNTLPNYLREHDLKHLAAPLQGLLPVTSLLLAVPLGLLSDRFSPRKLAIAGLSLFCVFMLLIWWLWGDVPTAAALFGPYFLCGMAAVMIDNSVRPLYLKRIGGPRQTVKLALLQMASTLGFGAGVFAGGLAFRLLGWPLEMQYRLALPLGVLGLLAAVLMGDSEPVSFSLSAYRRSILRRTVLVYLGMVFVNALHFGMEAVCVAPFVKQLKMDDWGVGCYFGSIALVMSLTAVGTMWLREHATNRHRMWVWGLTGSAVFNIAVAFVTEPWQFFLLRFGHVIADAFMMIAGLQIVAHLFPRSRVGGPMGLVSVVTTVGMLSGMAMAGVVTQWQGLDEHWQLALPFVVVGVLVLMSVGVQTALRERF